MAVVKMTVEVSDKTRDRLKALAKKDGRPMMRYIEKLLEAHVAPKVRA